MKLQETYQRFPFKIKPLTPVHIASGSFLVGNRDYYIHNQIMHRIHYPALVANLPQDELLALLQQIKNEGVRSLLPKPRSKKVEKSRTEEDWKLILRQKMGMSAQAEEEQQEEEEEEQPEDSYSRFLEDVELYNGDLVGREDLAGKVHAISLDSAMRSFFPGSTLKGAMRTAFYVDRLLKEPARLDRLRFTWTNNPVEADYPLDREMTGLDRRNPGKDAFRQLWVRDSSYQSGSDSIDFFPVKIMNIASSEDEPDRLVWKKGGKRNVSHYRDADSIYWEMIKPGVEFTSELLLDHQLRQVTEDSAVAVKITKENLVHALNTFSKLIAEREIAYAETYGIDYLREFYQDLIQKCDDAMASGKAAYVAIGSGLPWHAKTIGSLIENTSLEKIRRHFYRYMGKFVYLPLKTSFHGMRLRRGQLGGKAIRPDKLKAVEPFPKTRHYVFVDGQPAYPPGWVCLELL